jgi:hypothetical protein
MKMKTALLLFLLVLLLSATTSCDALKVFQDKDGLITFPRDVSYFVLTNNESLQIYSSLWLLLTMMVQSTHGLLLKAKLSTSFLQTQTQILESVTSLSNQM